MNDRELLESAAKAAGRKYNVSRKTSSGWLLATASLAPNDDIVEDDIWRPLQDDGDALRLAAKLGICIVFIEDNNSVAAEHSVHGVIAVETMGAIGTRRCIVRAAAEIEKTVNAPREVTP
ncbi:hypothetical protein K5D38_11330 [Pseudomonas cichorii]|nr:hypothetical protein [Pseudomonas cichorii]